VGMETDSPNKNKRSLPAWICLHVALCASSRQARAANGVSWTRGWEERGRRGLRLEPGAECGQGVRDGVNGGGFWLGWRGVLAGFL
jgi:hypothetical protein